MVPFATSQILPYIALGLVVGMASSLGGIGGGSVIIPALILLFHYTDMKEVVGTSLGAITVIAIAGAVTHWKHGHVNVPAAVCIGLAGIGSAIIGAKLAHGAPNAWLQRGLGILLALVGIYLAFFREMVVRPPSQ